jgi:hypothetical protein
VLPVVLGYVFFLNGDQLQVSPGMYIQLTISKFMNTITKPLTNEGRIVLNMSAVTSPILLGLLQLVYIYGLPTAVACSKCSDKKLWLCRDHLL